MVFNLCSSAGVHGVLVLLFFAGGGPIGESVILGSLEPTAAGAAAELDEPDIGTDAEAVPEARLFRAGEVSDFTVLSAAIGRVCEGDDPGAASNSVRSARFDIGDREGSDAQLSDIEVKRNLRVREEGSKLLRESSGLIACGIG